MQVRSTRNVAAALALGEVFALLATALTLPVQAQNLVALNKPAQLQKNANRSYSSAAVGPGVAGAAKQAGQDNQADQAFKKADGSGTLVALLPNGKQLGQCALKHTDVTCDIAGYVARVTVKQTFHNPYKDKIEALYTFPLSNNGAVDEMVMKVGQRTIHGTIKKREEARQIYEQARANGQVASLLDQERTNIFNQSVANIEPGKEIEITIKYVETLPYENGKYTFAFPTVVGPRFIPGQPLSAKGQGWAANTDKVGDASLITPPIAPAGERAGHDISISVNLNAGLPIEDLKSQLHDVDVTGKSGGKARISLVDKNTIPNKDFVLNWSVAQENLKSGYLTYKNSADKDGYFTVMLMPPKKITPDKIAPKEMIFVIDCSGSQSGPPLQKAKETMNYILDHMNADDTFQIIAFSDNTRTFATQPQKVSEEMKDKAHKFISTLEGNGGTWMAPAVENACKIPADDHRLRIVTFMTDGYVGNDFEVLGMVKKMRGTSRWFPFGTGNSVNHMLIDGIAKEGGGEPDYVLLNSSGNEAGKKFYDRISTPVLTDVKINFDGVKVKEVYPGEVADVWAEKPLYFKGKYTAGGAGTVKLTGYVGGKAYEQKLAVNFPDNDSANPGIASLWARAKVDRLISEDYLGAQNGAVNKELKEEIVKTALDHHIMTQYTSFVAVDEKTVVKDGKLQTIVVPVEMPDGVSREKVFGPNGESAGGAGGVVNTAFSGGMRNRAVANRYRQRFPYASYGSNAPQGATNGMALAQAGQTRSYGMAAIPSPSALPPPPLPGSPDSGPMSMQKSKSLFYGSPRHMQIVDAATPLLKDRRESTKAVEKADKKEIAGKETDSRVLVTLTFKSANLTLKQKALLKALGFVESVAVKDKTATKLARNQMRGTIALSKVKEIEALEFVQSVLLNSDPK